MLLSCLAAATIHMEVHGVATAGEGDYRMKVTVDVDCTPEEARRFLGLPDLTPVHAV